MTSIAIKYEIADLVQDIDKEPLTDLLTCHICMETYFNKQVYQCKEGHCACINCWKMKLKSNVSDCFYCRLKIGGMNNLSRNRGIESMVTNLLINCPYIYSNIIYNNNSYNNKNNSNNNNTNNSNNNNTISNKLIKDNHNGCKEKFKIGQLESHLLVCKYKFVKCNNEGCSYIGRLNDYISYHQNDCDFNIIECNKCKEKIGKVDLLHHINSKCPQQFIQCKCKDYFKRSELNSHIENQCPNTIIKCKYSKNCNQEYKRSDLSIHLRHFNHCESMMSIIEDRDREIQIYKNQLQEANDRCNKLITNFNVLDKVFRNLQTCYANKWEITQFRDKIKNFGVLDSIFSSMIFIGPFELYLGLSLTGENGYNNKDIDYLSIYVYNYNKEQYETIEIQGEFEVVNSLDNSNKKKKSCGKSQNDNDDSLIEVVLLKLSNISKESGFLLNNDTLSINFSLSLLNNNRIVPLKS